MFQQMLDLDGGIVCKHGKLLVQCFHNGHGMAGAVEKVRVTESNVFRSHAELLADVGEHDLALYDAKRAFIDGDHRAMPAQVLATAAGFCGADPHSCLSCVPWA